VSADRSGIRPGWPDAGCGAASGKQWGYQIRKYQDLGINRHTGTGVMAKSFFYDEDFSICDEHKLYGIMKTGPQDTRRGIQGEAGEAAGPTHQRLVLPL
jgi:hypothetical protein